MCNEPLDNLSRADSECHWRSSVIASIELASVLGKGSPIVHFDLVASLRLALALDRMGYFIMESVPLGCAGI